MAGFDNEVLFAIGERLESSTSQAIDLMQDVATDVSRINHVGDPNNVVSANPSSICHDPVSGFLWLKISGTGTTVWQRIFSEPSAPVVELTGNSGIAVPDGSGNINVITSHSSPIFVGTSSTLKVDFLDATFGNLILGSTVAQTLNPLLAQGLTGIGARALDSVVSAQSSVAVGGGSLQALTTGSFNTMTGANSGHLLVNGGANTGHGYGVLANCVSGASNCAYGATSLELCTGSTNTACGINSLNKITSGNSNIALGSSSGTNYTSSESSNVMIANAGVLGESNVIRIGDQGGGAGQQNASYMAGITSSTVAGSAPVGVASTGQLSSLGFGTSSQVLTSNGPATSPTFQALPARTLVTTYTSGSGTWTINANTVWVEAILYGGGGGGASGRKATSGASNGGGGGGPGEVVHVFGTSSVFTGGLAYSIGSGGTGGASQTATAAGITGNPGNNSTLGNLVAKGGNPGTGVAAGGGLSVGVQGLFQSTVALAGSNGSNGAGSNAVSAGSIALPAGYGVPTGGGAGGAANVVTPQQGGTGGAQVNAAGTVIVAAASGGIDGGTIAGGNGGTPTATGGIMGAGLGGGGGGGLSSGIIGGAGGNGSSPGGGGGGGGGGVTAVGDSGAGGNGGDGKIIIIEHF